MSENDNPARHLARYQFPRGKSGNPGGRPKAAVAMAALIREKTNDGADLVDFALKVQKGEIPEMADAKSRRWAHDWLSDRGFGKPIQDIDVLIGTVDLTPEQQALLEALKMSPHERRSRIAELKARAIEAAADAVSE